ncbi:hypothetical protein LTS17_008070 [Exophiala oligosperma]
MVEYGHGREIAFPAGPDVTGRNELCAIVKTCVKIYKTRHAARYTNPNSREEQRSDNAKLGDHSAFGITKSVPLESKDDSQLLEHTLSRISERSPHQSMISTNSPDLFTHSPYQAAINPVDSTPIPSLAQSGAEAPRRPSYLPLATPKPIFSTSQTPSTFRSSPLSTPPLAQDADSFSASVGYSQPTYQSAYSIAPRPRTADATISRKNGIENLRQSNIPVPDIPAPKSVVYPTPTSMTRSMYQHSSKSQPDLTKRTSMTRGSKRSSGATMLPPTPKSGSTHGPSGILYEPQVPDYWSSSRLDVQDLSSTLRYDRGDRISGQYDDPVVDGRERENVLGIVTVPGKHDTRVLRKKSLKRMTRTSSVAV